MLTHIRVLAWLHIIHSGLGLLLALFLLTLFGGIAGYVGSVTHNPDARIAAPIVGGVGTLVFIVIAAVALPGLVAGIGLLKLAPWSRILGIIISAIDLLSVPFGTALGIYGLWVLTKRETEALFSRQPPAGVI
jgi:hypothetical protein